MVTISIFLDNQTLFSIIKEKTKFEAGIQIKNIFSDLSDITNKATLSDTQIIIISTDFKIADFKLAIETLTKYFTEKQILILSDNITDEYLQHCLRLGADGYIQTSENFVEDIKIAANGGTPVSSIVAEKILKTFKLSESKAFDFHITLREVEVLELLAKGFTYRMIAIDLGISIETVRQHIKNIYHKLHVKCAPEAIAKSIKEKIIFT